MSQHVSSVGPQVSLQPREKSGSELSEQLSNSFHEGAAARLASSFSEVPTPLREGTVSLREAAKTSAVLNRSLISSGSQRALSIRHTNARFIVLLGIAGFMFGNFYFFDQTSATEKAIEAQTGMSPTTFGVLSSVYSWPNVVLPLVGGVMIDRIGLKTSTLVFTALTVLGSSLFTLGLWNKSTTMLIAARVVFGVGGESQNVACMAFVCKWFKETNMAFATAIAICVSRLGSVAAFDTQGPFVHNLGVVPASFIGTCICGFSMLSAIFTVAFDVCADRKDKQKGLEVFNESQDENINVLDAFKLGNMFFLLTISLVATYVAVFPFLQVISANYLNERFDFEESAADSIAAYVNLTSAFLSPILGILVDRFGRRPMLLCFSSGCFVLANVGFILWPACERCWSILSLYILMGIGLSVYGSVIWPCVPLVVEEHMVGTAYGLATSAQNLGMAVSPMLIKWLNKASGGWTTSFIYILVCVSTGLCAGLVVWIMDYRSDRRLILPKLPELSIIEEHEEQAGFPEAVHNPGAVEYTP